MCLLIAYECEDITSIDNMITRINILIRIRYIDKYKHIITLTVKY